MSMKLFFLLQVLTISYVVGQKSSDGYTDENRPYKFAFAIEGYQHRSEMKDEKGIITGEFGFVTGDGIYHETVYATDENGNFKIISMKNYYIGLPGEMMMNMPLPTQPPTTTTTTTQRQEFKKIELSGIQGCSGCRIPTTTPSSQQSPLITNMKQQQQQKQQNLNIPPTTYNPKTSNYGQKNQIPDGKLKQPEYMYNNQLMKNLIKPNDKNPPQNLPSKSQGLRPSTPSKMTNTGNRISSNLDKEIDNTPILTSDPSGLLYEFNQTQTFQGHHEKGYVDNSKMGDYFVNQRDGIKQIVEYIANDSGYQPYIRFVNLTASETPDPETEKIRNMLQGMYFRWFYGRG